MSVFFAKTLYPTTLWIVYVRFGSIFWGADFLLDGVCNKTHKMPFFRSTSRQSDTWSQVLSVADNLRNTLVFVCLAGGSRWKSYKTCDNDHNKHILYLSWCFLHWIFESSTATRVFCVCFGPFSKFWPHFQVGTKRLWCRQIRCWGRCFPLGEMLQNEGRPQIYRPGFQWLMKGFGCDSWA